MSRIRFNRGQLLALCVLVAACGEPAETAGLDADARTTDGGPADAGPHAPDATTSAADAAVFAPSPANLGWIGGTCSRPTDCAFAESMCLTQDFPNGMCTRECSGTCPDRHQSGDTITACIDGRPFGFDEGMCVARCDRTVLPPTGCPAGYRCLPKNRFLDTATVLEVCVPIVAAGPCRAVDEVIDIDYPQDGKLWIPAEAQCGGDFPLAVLLHGINPEMNHTPSLAGGRHLEYELRSLIDAHLTTPVILAEPVQTNSAAASSGGLYDPNDFEPAHHLELIEAELDRRGITIASLSYVGHSGAGCDSRNGLYLVLKRFAALIPAHAPSMRLWGLADVCYSGSYHYSAPMTTLADTGTAIINLWSEQGDPTAFENGLIADPAPVDCATSLFGHCIRHKTKPWCSYRSLDRSNIHHDDNPFFFLREAFPQVFSPDPNVLPCR